MREGRAEESTENTTHRDRMGKERCGLWEFHVSRRARDRYRFDQSLFSFDGKVIIKDVHNARILSEAINAERDLEKDPDHLKPTEMPVSAGDLNAMGLMDETVHAMLGQYRREINPNLMPEILARLEDAVGRGMVDEMLTKFVDEFPPLTVYRDETTINDYLDGVTDGISHRLVAIEELLLLWLANANPAFNRVAELFDDSQLRAHTGYLRCLDVMRGYLAVQPSLEDPQANLLESLRAPAVNHPLSPTRQLEFIRSQYADQEFVTQSVDRVVKGIDLLAEENKPFFGHGPGPPVVLDFSTLAEDEGYGDPDHDDDPDDPYGEPNAPERYSIDHSWMPRLVLMAKNAHVWLAQLSERYDKPILALDEIPDEELERLKEWGFTGLWLIGVWERSRASRRIKRAMGDDQAEASAYSLEAYRIAADLGGESAYDAFKERAINHGIRLSTDMVPNHVGMDSQWVIEHPDWFITSDHPPFPSYRFNGEDLSDDDRVGIYLEDHYYDRTDAAVVFKSVDRSSGEERYIYHGNDGTSMPWNDTAQLDYRNPEVREAVIETILQVARRSPIIRFDAAMVLTRKNIHRLWFPAPGSGGDIPSRSEHSLSKKEFNELMPTEFWREVVDRVKEEAPDTLLLAEAFWLLEGYFVRTLGMHRVYNSAFMNMLCAELNREYRQLIKNTLEFDPEILKRYVNFMSNPDELTAIDQFGDGDKYFGVTTLLITMPGLPMFGHGQIEGLYEKYGMEFVRPRWREEPDLELIKRHEKQLFSLMKKRELFAEAENFELYDLVCDDQSINENVFAYSNRSGDESSLVLFNNSPHPAHGRIFTAAVKKTRDSDGDIHHSASHLGISFDIKEGRGSMLRARDEVTSLEFLFVTSDLGETGMVIDLGAYELRVLTSIRQFTPRDHQTWTEVLDSLNGSGCVNLEDGVRELRLAPVLEPLVELSTLMAGGETANDDIEASLGIILAAIERETGNPELQWDPAKLLILHELHTAEITSSRALLINWALATLIGSVVESATPKEDEKEDKESYFDTWCLDRALTRVFQACGLDQFNADRNTLVVRLMLSWEDALVESLEDESVFLEMILSDQLAQQYLGVHRQAGRKWFRREGFEDMLAWVSALALTLIDQKDIEALEASQQSLSNLHAAMENSGYTIRGLRRSIKTRQEEMAKLPVV